MKNSSKNAQWLKKLQEEGAIKKSKTLEDEPTLIQSVIWIWRAFSLLSGSRAQGFNGPDSITFTEMANFVWLEGLTAEEARDDIIHFITMMDAVYLEDFYAKQSQKEKAEKAKQGH